MAFHPPLSYPTTPITTSTCSASPSTGHASLFPTTRSRSTQTPARTRGVAFQIGAPATLLVEPAYTAVVEAFRARMSRTYEAVNGSGLLCFLVDDASKKVVTVPTMTMHFDGMDMELLFGNYFAYTGKQSGGGGGDVLCLMIGKSSTGSRIGNYLQISLPMGWIGMGLMDWFSIWIHLVWV